MEPTNDTAEHRPLTVTVPAILIDCVVTLCEAVDAAVEDHPCDRMARQLESAVAAVRTYLPK